MNTAGIQSEKKICVVSMGRQPEDGLAHRLHQHAKNDNLEDLVLISSIQSDDLTNGKHDETIKALENANLIITLGTFQSHTVFLQFSDAKFPAIKDKTKTVRELIGEAVYERSRLESDIFLNTWLRAIKFLEKNVEIK